LIKHIVRIISVIAIILSGLWFYSEGGFEPIITALMGIAGLLASRTSKKGKNSPIIFTTRDVNINYSISSAKLNELQIPNENKDKVIDRLRKLLDDKEIKIENQDATIQVWVKKYNELKSYSGKHIEESGLNKQAMEKLNNAEIEDFEEILKTSLQNNLIGANDKKKNAATNAYSLGILKELYLEYWEAIDYYYQAVQLDHKNIEYLNRCGKTLIKLGLSNKAIEYHDKALKIALEKYGDNHHIVVYCYQKIGNAWNDSGNASNAIKYYNKALKIALKLYSNKNAYVGPKYFGFAKKTKGDMHPHFSSLYSDIANALDNLGASNQAFEYHHKALKIALEIYGDNHPNIAALYNNIGLTWHNLGDSKQAIEYYGKAMKIALEMQKGNHPDIATGYNNIGVAWDKLGDFNKAIKYYDKALKIFDATYGSDHPYTKSMRSKIDSASKEKDFNC
jgi:tetratricopeptide (TPR) repeat protein